MSASPPSGEDLGRLRAAYAEGRRRLLGECRPDAHWEGRLSSSALSTATAVSALTLVSRERHAALIAAGVRWLASHQNPDGGWGDTPDSPSNLPTTMLVQAALRLSAVSGPQVGAAANRAEEHLRRAAGPEGPGRVAALREAYGADRTFAVPILTNCALAAEAAAPASVRWNAVPSLPFELACLPRFLLRWLRLGVVSYALPALIAIGQLVDRRRATRNPFLWLTRRLARGPSLRRLEAIQPASGGFLEAVPLTSFVVMSLAALGGADSSEVCGRGVAFILRAARPDGSWPIDLDLSCWLTSLSVAALRAGGGEPAPEPEATAAWLLARQHTERHPYTGSPPGAWAWTGLPGGVPDADDTAGALLALAALRRDATPQAGLGVRWLLGLQNRDGGWPTFCRGWGRLPFDRSAPDLTAHAVRAITAWPAAIDEGRQRRAVARGLDYLRGAQRPDGYWVPLWFGNQSAQGQENPVYGTSRVLAAYRDLGLAGVPEAVRGVEFLLEAQNADGSWGGDRGLPGTVEETALAVEALAGLRGQAGVRDACLRGALWLAGCVADGGLDEPAPIGLYFARLWYSEMLYPIIWTVAALGRLLGPDGRGGA